MPLPSAAFVNGPMSRALDFGDIAVDAPHSSEHIIPTLLSVADMVGGVNGKEFITAFAVSSEIQTRIGMAGKGTVNGFKHFKAATIFQWGPICGAAKLLDLSVDQTWNAIGLGYSCLSSGDMRSMAEGNLVKRAVSSGINFIDTAPTYSGGKSEEIIGKAIKGERQSLVLATKVGSPTGLGPSDACRLSRKLIVRRVEESLRRLQTDYIDIYYAHAPDNDTPLDETLRAFDDLVHQGKVRYIGCSNFPAWLVCKALWMSDHYNLMRFECIEPPYNLLTRDIEYELLPLCVSEGLGVSVYNPLAGEMLTGRHTFGKPPLEGRFTLKDLGKSYLERYWSATNFEAVDHLKQVADKHGCSLARFALAWILSNPAITSFLSGVISPEQLEENIKATEIVLSPEELQACDSVWQLLRPPRFSYVR